MSRITWSDWSELIFLTWTGWVKTFLVQLVQVVSQGDTRAVVVAQLEERSLPTPEILGSNPVGSKNLSTNCTIEKTKNKEKVAGNGPSFKKSLEILYLKRTPTFFCCNFFPTTLSLSTGIRAQVSQYCCTLIGPLKDTLSWYHEKQGGPNSINPSSLKAASKY